MERQRFVLPHLLAALCAAPIASQDPIDLGTRRELLVDDFLFDEVRGDASLEMHRPVPREIVMVHDAPWEGNGCGYHTIFQDDGVYRMYYKSWQISAVASRPSGDDRLFICYAESPDGIRWTKPDLGLHSYDDSNDNNIIINEVGGGSPHDFSPFIDSSPGADSGAKYKAIGRGIGAASGLFAFQSQDAIHWTILNDGQPVMTGHPFDTQNTAFWDPNIGQYRAYIRDFRTAAPGAPRRRSVMTATSDGLTEWSPAEWLRFGDAPPEQLYTNQIKPYHRAPHIYIGFPARYVQRAPGVSYRQLPGQEARKRRGGERSRYATAVTDSLLMTSRDGLHFARWDETFLRPGLRANNWAYGDNYVAWHVVETTSDAPGNPPELSIYATEDYFTGHASKLRRYTLRLDGFASLHAASSGGSILTRPIVFDGERLSINYSTSAAGRLLVELQHPDGSPIPNRSLEDCDEIFGDQLHRTVSWGGDADLADYAGKPLRMLVRLKEADLYSFRFHAQRAPR